MTRTDELVKDFSRDYLRDREFPWVAASREIIEVDDHGEALLEVIFKDDDGTFWQIYFSEQQSTGYSDFDWNDEFTGKRVELKEVVTKKWVPWEG